MAISQDLRHALRNAFSPTGSKEIAAKLNSGLFVGVCSIQLRTDLWGTFPPQVAREMITLLGGGGTATPSQPLRTALSGALGAQAACEFITLIAPAEVSSSSSGEEASSSGYESSSSSSGV